MSWLTLPQGSQLLMGGYLTEGVALDENDNIKLLADAHKILAELIGNVSQQVSLHHDPDWEEFPEVGEALKQAGWKEKEACFCVAICPSIGRFAVGVGGGWKKREPVAKLAMAVMVASAMPPMMLMSFQWQWWWTKFSKLLQNLEILPPDKPSKADGFGGWGGQSKAQKRKAPAAAADAPVFLNMPLESALVQAGFPEKAPAVVWDGELEIMSSAHQILTEILGCEDMKEEVEFLHDPDWTEMPEVGEALKAAGGPQECYVVAKIAGHGKWAVGIHSGWKKRESIAKLALCVAFATQDDSFAAFSESWWYEDFSKYMQTIGLVDPSGADDPDPAAAPEPSPKKAKGPSKGAAKKGSGPALASAVAPGLVPKGAAKGGAVAAMKGGKGSGGGWLQ